MDGISVILVVTTPDNSIEGKLNLCLCHMLNNLLFECDPGLLENIDFFFLFSTMVIPSQLTKFHESVSVSL